MTPDGVRGLPVIELRGASLGYDGETVLRGVDLEVHAGEFVGLSGANGSGKTTLLRSMLGFLPLLGGRAGRAVPPSRIGYVPQGATLDPYFPLSADEVVAMGAYGRLHPLQRFPRGERKRVEAALERVGLAHLGRAAFFELSGGQRQRVLVARALNQDPELLLLDEPFSGLDRDSREAVLQGLVLINRQARVTVVLSSHDSDLLDRGGGRVVRLADGRVHDDADEDPAPGSR